MLMLTLMGGLMVSHETGSQTYELIAAVIVLMIGLALKACHVDSMVDAVVFLAAAFYSGRH